MEDSVRTALTGWENFYVIVGSSGAALTGLQFVVMTLITDSRARRSSLDVDTFGTPTVVHFCAVLLVAAILSAPWTSAAPISLALLALGVAGLIYGGVVTMRTRRTIYKPVLEDWLFHVILPSVAYLIIAGAAVAIRRDMTAPLFAMAGALLLLLFAGIHNAWDTVTFIASGEMEQTLQHTDAPLHGDA